MSIAPSDPLSSMSSDPKRTTKAFSRKVVRFVANPTTDWHELNSQVMDRESSTPSQSSRP